MRAEDVKIGAWVRWSGEGVVSPCDRPWKVARMYDDGHIEGTAVDGVVCTADMDIAQRAFAKLGPWTPRVGDRIRHTASRAELVVGYVTENDDGGVITADGYMLRFHEIEPCAPPEAKPETFKTHDAGTYQFTREEVEQVSANPRTWSDMVAQASLPRVYGWDLSDPIRAVPIEGNPRAVELSGPALYSATMNRDHNATCAKCGGKAYQGIGAVRCVEPVCDDPKGRMPEHVRRVTRRGERVWSAEGRGVLASHPLKEGAILAWREAVNRG